MAHSILGVPLEIPGTFGRPRVPEYRTFGENWFLLIEGLLQEGRIKNHPLEVRTGGFEIIPNSLEDFRVGNVRAKKLVVSLLA